MRDLTTQSFYAALTLVFGTLCFVAAGLGVMGLFDYPTFSTHTTSLFCTTFGGAMAAVFMTSSVIFSKRAHASRTSSHQLNLSLRKSCTITRGDQWIHVLTKGFEQRFDLLLATPKSEKLKILRAGEWALHKEEGQMILLAKFEYETTTGFHQSSVSLKLFPKSGPTKNLVFDPMTHALFLHRFDTFLPFKGGIAVNFLMQKMWKFVELNFEKLVEKE